MPSILFVCRANQFRSPLAAAFFQREIKKTELGSGLAVGSAGTWTTPGLSVPPIVLEIAHKFGLSGLSRHASRQLTSEILDQYDLIIVMEINQKEAIISEFPARRGSVFLLSEVADGNIYDIADPVTPDVDPMSVAQEIYTLIQKGTTQIKNLAQSLSSKE